jgi:hypothetical protein
MPNPYTLYGSYASYYTAKSRSHLRKKGIPFVERLPSEPKFRDTVRPTSGSHRIPQLLTPDGLVIQGQCRDTRSFGGQIPKVSRHTEHARPAHIRARDGASVQ